MPFLEKIVSRALVDGLIHNINTNTGKGQRKMLNDMKRINSDLRVFEIAVSDVTIRLPHVEGNEENTIPTGNAKIRVARVRKYKRDEVLRAYDQLAELALAVRIEDTVRLMKQVVPEFKSKNSRFEILDKINN